MKIRRSNLTSSISTPARRRALAGSISTLLAIGVVAGVTSSQAAVYNWGSAGAGGTGTWIDDNATANWFFGGSDVPWAAGNTATFGGAVGAVGVSGSIAGVNGLTFNTTGYSLTGGTLNLTGNTFTLGTGIAASIGSTLAGTVGLNLTGGGTLTLTSTTNTLTGAYNVGVGSTLIASGDTFATTGNDVVVSGTYDQSSTTTPATLRFINNLTGSGTITSASSAGGGVATSIRVKAGDFAGSIVDGGVGKPTALLFQATGGLLNLSGTNTYTGDTLIREGGTLRISSATALAPTSYLRFEPGGALTATLELNSGNLTRTLGTTVATGTSLINFGAGTDYLAALGADRTVNLGAPQIVWGTTAGFNPTILGFGSANATNKVIFSTPLSFGNVARTIDVRDGAAAIEGELSGAVTGGGTTGVLTKTGTGALLLSATNTIASFRINQGSVTLSGVNTGSVFNSIGVNAGDNGTLNLIGGGSLNTGAVDFNLGDVGTARGTVNMQSTGTLTIGTLFNGKGIGAVGVFNQTNGLVNGTGGGEWQFGSNATAYGIYNLSAGMLSPANNFQIGFSGAGVFNQTGGTATFTGWLSPARNGAASNGLVNVSSGGVLTHNGGGATAFLVGEQGKGVVNLLPGGTINANSTNGAGLRLSAAGTAQGIFNVIGGALTAVRIGDGGGTSFLYLNGGTVKPVANEVNFITGLDNAVVGPAGITLDSGIFAATIAQNLAAPGGAGIVSIPITTGGAGYVGEPIVNITGGGGTGATARAIITNGVLTGFTITNPGINYTGAPAIVLAGGGPTTAATTGAATTGANVTTGGVTKAGAGTLTLSGANSYLGATTISAGTLGVAVIGNGGVASPLGASSNAAANLVFDGGTLQYTGATGSTDRNFTINAGKTATLDVSTAATALTLTGGSAATNGNLNKIGLGTLILSGANLHTGNTIATAGVLAASGTRVAPYVINGGRLAPAYQAVGTLTVPALTFNTTGGVDFEFNAGGAGLANDIIAISAASGLTLGTASLNLYLTGGTTPFAENGTYPLFTYNTAFNGSLTGAFTVANSQPGKFYGINNNVGASRIELSIGDAVVTAWATDGSGSWTSPVNWTGGVPNSAGASATFGSVLNAPNAPATVTLDGSKTVGTIIFDNSNTYNVTQGTGGTITVDNGIGTAAISTVTGSHSISAPIALVNPTNLAAAAGTTLTLLGNISGGQRVTLTGAGTVLLSGSNALGGAATINSGTLDVSGAAALNGATSIVEKNGGVLRLSGGGSVTLAQPIALDINGGTVRSVGDGTNSGTANGTGNFAFDIATGTSANFTGLVSNNGGTLVKRGGGSLTISNAGANVLAASGATGITAVLQEGSLTLDGGAAATYAVSGSEFAVGDNTPNQVNLTLASGTLNVGTYLSIGRGNGTTGLSSALNITGGTLNSQYLYTGFANGVAGYNANPIINISGTGAANASIGVRLAESPGSFSTATLSGSAQLFSGGNIEVGFGGRGLLKIGAGTTASVNQVLVGNAAGGSGAIYNRGTLIDRSGASVTHFALGNATNAYGFYLHDTAVPATYQEVGVGGAGGGSGVFEVRSGSVTAAAWLTLNRTNAVNATNAMVLVQGGTLTTPNIPGHFYADQLATVRYNTVIDVGTGGLITGGPLSDLNLINAAFAGDQSSLTVHDGGQVQLGHIFAGQALGAAVVNLNGGKLIAAAAGNLLDTNLDAVLVHTGGATIDTNGFNVTNATNALVAPTGNGVQSIPLIGNGAGYIGRPIVDITDPTGIGATAVANFDEATGLLTGITITSPGTGYTSPSVVLVGGGASTAASVGSAVLAANANTGGFTKQGAGTLTLSATNTYAGPTVIEAGTLALTGSISGSTSIDVRGGAIFDVSGAGGFTVGAAQTLKGSGTVNGGVSVTGTVNPGSNVGTLTFNNPVAFATNSTLALDITGVATFDKLVAPDVSLASNTFLAITLGYTPAYNQSWLVVDNTGGNAIAANFFTPGAGQLTEGKHFFVGGQELVISYLGGTGNDVTLTAVPEPGSIAMLLTGLGSFAGLRRFRRRSA